MRINSIKIIITLIFLYSFSATNLYSQELGEIDVVDKSEATSVQEESPSSISGELQESAETHENILSESKKRTFLKITSRVPISLNRLTVFQANFRNPVISGEIYSFDMVIMKGFLNHGCF